MSDPALSAADPILASPVYPQGSRINDAGHLEVAGCDLVELAREFGTPAYIYSEDHLRGTAQAYLEAFGSRTDRFEVIFASKAAPFTAAYRVFREEGLSVDVASGGELHMALRAGFDGPRIYMHGNNKTEAELRYALASGVGHIVIDSFDEIERLERLVEGRQRVLIRVTPGIKADTHSFIQTGQLDSKFGFGLADGLAQRAVERVQASRSLELAGLHAHIGSQIFELGPYTAAIAALAEFAAGLEIELLNIGGGLGIAYTEADEPPSIDAYAEIKVAGVAAAFDPTPRILVEPGRSLVGNAGLTIYTVGTVKEIPGVRTWVAVDGGMSDNLRPMLYGSRYDAILANRPAEPPAGQVTIAGMHCESGDVIVRDIELPEPRIGEVLVTPATGAYGYAMASNYNGVPRPPVIMCSGGDARVVVRRESWDDLIARDT